MDIIYAIVWTSAVEHLYEQYRNWENMKSFIITLHWPNFVQWTTFANALFIFWVSLQQRVLSWLSKESLAVICIPTSFWMELLKILSDLIFIAVFFPNWLSKSNALKGLLL